MHLNSVHFSVKLAVNLILYVNCYTDDMKRRSGVGLQARSQDFIKGGFNACARKRARNFLEGPRPFLLTVPTKSQSLPRAMQLLRLLAIVHAMRQLFYTQSAPVLGMRAQFCYYYTSYSSKIYSNVYDRKGVQSNPPNPPRLRAWIVRVVAEKCPGSGCIYGKGLATG